MCVNGASISLLLWYPTLYDEVSPVLSGKNSVKSVWLSYKLGILYDLVTILNLADLLCRVTASNKELLAVRKI